MKTVSLKLTEELDAQLTSLAQAKRFSKSKIIREALQAYFSGRRPASFLSLAKDLAGCVAGPGDLSFNKEHFKDFGK